MREFLKWVSLGGFAGALMAIALVPGTANFAADHLEPAARTNPTADSTPDLPADIADIFAWYAGDTVRIVLTFAGPNNPDLAANYDRDVLYKILISTAPPLDTPDIVIKARFGPGQRPGEWGVRFEGLPGVSGALEGPVETTLEKDGVKARAGLFDDPFFFDSLGFRETRAMGTIRFKNTRDFFGAANDTAIVIEIPRDRFAGATMPLGFSAATARFGGQL